MAEFDVGFMIFPDYATRLTGPFEVLSRSATPASLSTPSRFAQTRTHVIARTMAPDLSDRGLGIVPSCTFATCPDSMDLRARGCGRGGGAGRW